MTHTYEQVLTYEVARDLLNTYIADCSAALADERAKDKPSAKKVAKIADMQQELFHVRENMDMTDDAAMRKIIQKYRRTDAAVAA